MNALSPAKLMDNPDAATSSRARAVRRPNALNPERMTPAERVGEVCEILALGLTRLRRRQSSQVSELTRDSSLHFPPHQSGHAKRPRRRKA
jgi:hypothetical protein